MQKEKKTTKAQSSARGSTGASQRNRKHPTFRKRYQSERVRPLDAQPGTGASSLRNHMPPSIKIPLRYVNGVHVDLMTKPKGHCLLEDESKLLKALEDLLPLTSGIKGFKDNTRWTDKSSVSEVFHIFLLKTSKLIHHEELGIVLKDGRYCWRLKQPVYFDVDCPVMPVYWISQLEKVNKGSLFDLCFYLIRYLNNSGGVGLWQEDSENYIYQNIEENLVHYKTNHGNDPRDETKKEIESLEKAHQEFGNKGEATKFYNRLIRAGSSKRVWLREYDSYFGKYKPNTQILKDIYSWLELGKQLMVSGQNMHKFISLPSEYEGQEEQYDELPMTPDEAVKFLWRTDDAFHYELTGMCEAQTSNAGGVPFFLDCVIEKPSDFEDTKNCFPEVLIKFMKAGRMMEKKYRSVFEDTNKLSKALFKPIPLLDIL